MSRDERRWIILLVAVVIIAIVLVVAFVRRGGETETEKQNENIVANEDKYLTELEDGTKINTSEDLNSTKTFNNLEISNIQFTQKDGKSVLLADVKNTGSTTHEAEIVKITVLGENGETITVIKPVIGVVEPGETIQLNATITADVANAKDFTIEVAD